MKVLFVASGNKDGKLGNVVKNQSDSLKDCVCLDFFLISNKGFWGYLKNTFPLYKYLRIHKSDVLHSHYSLSAFVSTLALFLHFNKIPHVVSLMGSDTKLAGWNRIFVQIFHRFLWEKTIIKSERMKNELKLTSVEIIPNGVDLKKIEELEKNININARKKMILFASDPNREEKNYTLAKQAIELLGSDNIELKVVYNVPHEEVLMEILNCSLLLLTSKWEGSPNIVKEAMACNCPIVATDVGDVKWLFGNEPGHYLTSFDPRNVAAKIKLALSFAEEKSRTMGRQRIIELGLDSETVAKRIIKVYEDAKHHK